MKNMQWFFVLLFSSLLTAQSTSFHEIDSISQVADYLNGNNDTLLLFDIDNTLLCPPTDLGSDHWFVSMVNQHLQRGVDKAEVYKKVLPIYFHVVQQIDLVPTEPNLPETIATLERQCEHVICITARSPCLIEKTVHDIKNNSLWFHVPEVGDIEFGLEHPSYYQSGILFCCRNPKGEVILAFLDEINYEPTRIVFVDDKEYNLHSIEAAALERGIEFVGLHYTGCNERVNSFNAEATEKELQEFLVEHPLVIA